MTHQVRDGRKLINLSVLEGGAHGKVYMVCLRCRRPLGDGSAHVTCAVEERCRRGLMGHEDPDPSHYEPEGFAPEVEAAAAVIRASWSDEDRMRRAGLDVDTIIKVMPVSSLPKSIRNRGIFNVRLTR